MSESVSKLFQVIGFRHKIYSFAKDDQKVFAEMFLLDEWQGDTGIGRVFYINIKTTVHNRVFDTMFMVGRAVALLDKYHGDKELQIEIGKLCHYLSWDTTIDPKEKSLIFQAWDGFFQ